MRDNLSLIKNYIYYFFWILNGRIDPPHLLFKRKRILKLAREFNCDTLIETGTADGKTIKYLRNHFKKLLSVEIFEPNYTIAKKRLEKFPNVKLYFGNSVQLLEKMTNEIQGNCIYWLDGHYSGDGTGKADSDCPLKEELQTILKTQRNRDVILIDDAREFYEHAGYPNLEYVVNKLMEINPEFNISVKNDCVIALPSKVYNI